MSCPHHSTTLLWLYGEAPEAHADHVAGCPECQQVASTHAGVVWWARGMVPRRTRTPLAVVGLLTLAAIVLLSLRLWPGQPQEEPLSDELPFHSPLDDRIEAARARLRSIQEEQPMEVSP